MNDISYRVRSAIMEAFRPRITGRVFTNGFVDVLGRSFLIKSTKTTLGYKAEIPSYFYSKVKYDSMAHNLPIPLITTHNKVRSFRSFESAYLAVCNVVNELCKVEIRSKEYYMAKGIVLDSEGVPLWLCTVSVECQETRDVGDISADGFFNCYINPIVFENLTSSVNKGIIRKVIPVMSSETVAYNTPSGERIRVKPSLIISDMEHLFYSPVLPVKLSTINDDINTFLEKNIDVIKGPPSLNFS